MELFIVELYTALRVFDGLSFFFLSLTISSDAPRVIINAATCNR